MNTKIGFGWRPDIHSLGAARIAQLKVSKLSDTGGFNFSGFLTLAETDSSGCFGITGLFKPK
jgi:hypothetical protein